MLTFRYIFFRRFHASIFIAWLSIGFIAGVALSIGFPYFSHFSWCILGLTLGIGAFLYRYSWCIVVIVIAGVLLGLWRGSLERQSFSEYEKYFGGKVRLTGVINEDPVVSPRGDMRIQLRDVTVSQESLPGVVWVSAHTKERLQRSDKVEISGKLREGFGSFAASMSYASVDTHAHGVDAARDIRDWFGGKVRQVIVEPEVSLGIGFLIGQRSSLPPDLDEKLRIAGLTHIVVASGYNLTILVRMCRRFFENISKYLTALSSGLLIIGFMAVTGWSPSMSRAGLVAGLSMAAWYYGRKISPFILLPFTAAISVLIVPSYVWGDVGWLLSFAAFGGVMIAAPLLQDYFFGEKKPGLIRQVLGETIAALIMTAPISILVFEQYSTYALIANLLVVPLIPFVMLTVFGAGVLEFVLPAIAFLVALPASALLQYMVAIVDYISAWPHALLEMKITPLGVGIFYGIVALILGYFWRKTGHNFRNDNLVE